MKRNAKVRVFNRVSSMRNILREDNNGVKIRKFLEKYFECELACREVIKDYKIDKKETEKEIRIIVKAVDAALRHIGINAREALLNNLFSANKTRGQCSAKKLRDAIVHDLSKEDVREVSRRFRELESYMDEFLRLFDIEA